MLAQRTNVHDLVEELQTRLVNRFVKLLLHAQALQIAHYDVLKGRVASAETAIGAVDPARDQDLFIDHNVRPFVAPGDWAFEPCSGHYDKASVSPS
jgi:formin-binding protein 1